MRGRSLGTIVALAAIVVLSTISAADAFAQASGAAITRAEFIAKIYGRCRSGN
jgi:hypothetical protein